MNLIKFQHNSSTITIPSQNKSTNYDHLHNLPDELADAYSCCGAEQLLVSKYAAHIEAELSVNLQSVIQPS